MRRLAWILAFCLGSVISLFAELKVSGVFRDDMYLTVMTNNTLVYNNSLETRLILERKTSQWRFYADTRAWLYQGMLTNIYGNTRLDIIRAFGRYFTPAGDFTIGKTYINLGLPGIFNPFELDKQLNLNDVNYDKQGIIALAWDYILSDLSGGVLYIRPDPALSNSGGGAALEIHAGSFDSGVVLHRKKWNQNLAGLYLKGDLGIGIQAAYAFHLNDLGQDTFHEVSVSLDYSFWEAKILCSLGGYYTDRGADNPADYVTVVSEDRFLQAHTYGVMNLSVIPSEFFRFSLDGFFNLVDGSMAWIPQAGFLLADGFHFSTLAVIQTGRDDSEFSIDRSGILSLGLRAELKL